MRVGIDIGPMTCTRTGVGNYCYYLLKNLVKAGTDCEFVGFSSGLASIELGVLDGVIAHRHIAVPTRLLYKIWSALKAPKVDWILGGVDVYHATNYFLPPTRCARRVVTIHDLSFLVVPELCSPRIIGPFSKGVPRFAAEADAILAYSESTKGDIVRYLAVDPAKVTVAPLAVDEDFIPISRDEAAERIKARYGIGEPFLLFVSTLEPRKNVPTLLRAFALLAKDIPHRLVLVGRTGWGTEEIFATLDSLNLGERVVRAGFVPQQDLLAFYCAADAFVFPTLYEGFGLPLLEALSCGCPVVTAKNSSVPEVTDAAALYADPRDPESVAAAVRRVLEDGSLRADLVARGRAQAKKFSWATCAQRTLEVYRSVA